MRVSTPSATVGCMLLCSAAGAGAAIRHTWTPRSPAVPTTWASDTTAAPPPPAITSRAVRATAFAPRSPETRGARNDRVPARPRTSGREIERWERVLASDPATERALRRLGHYAPLIREALTDRNVPAEFLYLPLIESEYLPRATSRVGAAGIWQFMPATARAYGLEVSTWVDERRDPIRSTLAAARHLRDLHHELGSWQLAAAAYNCGSPRVLRAIKGSPSNQSFWAIRHRLPPNTRDYVPRFLAAIRVAERRKPKGNRDAPPLRFREVLVLGGVPLAAVAARFGVSADTVRSLNAQLVRGSTPPNRTWPVRIPVDRR